MKKPLLLICTALLWTLNALAQWKELGGTLSVRLDGDNIFSIAMEDSGNVFAGGDFKNDSGYYYVAKYEAVTKSWYELGNTASGGIALNANGTIKKIVSDQNNNIYAFGNFTNAAGQTYVAKWDKATNTWAELGTLSANSNIMAMVMDKMNNIYVCGDFTDTGGNYIAKWDGTAWGKYGTSLAPVIDPYSGMAPPSLMAIDDLGTIYVVKDRLILANNGVNWIDTILVSPGGDPIYTMAIDPDRNLYIGGRLTGPTGIVEVFKVDTKTKVVSMLGSISSGSGGVGDISALATINSSEVFAGGLLDLGTTGWKIAKWSKSTNEWSQVGTDTDEIKGIVYSIILDTTTRKGNILVGGRLYNYAVGGMDMKQFVAEYNSSCSAYFTVIPTSTPHTYTITNYCTGTGAIKYSWDWGDGSPNDTGSTPSHVYATAGFYQITVSIEDSTGCISSYCLPSHTYLAKTTADMVYVNVVMGVSINDITFQERFTVFPNPSDGQITISSQVSQSELTATVTDLLGRTVHYQKMDFAANKSTLSLTLPTGIYLLQLQDQNRNVARERINIR